MKPWLPLSALFCCCLLLACDSDRDKAPRTFDHVAEDLPFARPVLKAVDALPEAPPLSEIAQKNLNLRRAFFARDFAFLDKAINDAHDRYVQGQSKDNEAHAFLESLDESQLAGIDACKDWIAAMPASYAAHWICGAMWHDGAWIARSGEFANKVTPIRFALMRERLARSNALLEKANTLSPKPVEALTLLAANRSMVSDVQSARALLQQAEAIMPADGTVHQTRINFSVPEWGGSVEEVAAAIDAAKKAGVDGEWLLDFHDTYVAVPWKLSDPGAERAYWEKAIAEQPTFHRLKSAAEYFHRVQNWRDCVPAASRLIEKYPDYATAYWLRGVANEKLGNIPEALSDYRIAAALGDDAAIQSLIQAHIQGGLGVPKQSWDALDKVCRYGAALGSPAAANCLASSFWEGDKVGPPFRTDIPQSFAWHLFAARAGYHNSQYDLGWLLLSGRAPGVNEGQAKSNGLFWLRRAAELDHQFAKKKLEEGGYTEAEEVQKASSRFERAIELLWPFLRWII